MSSYTPALCSRWCCISVTNSGACSCSGSLRCAASSPPAHASPRRRCQRSSDGGGKSCAAFQGPVAADRLRPDRADRVSFRDVRPARYQHRPAVPGQAIPHARLFHLNGVVRPDLSRKTASEPLGDRIHLSWPVDGVCAEFRTYTLYGIRRHDREHHRCNAGLCAVCDTVEACADPV